MSSPSSERALSAEGVGWLDGLDTAFELAAASGVRELSYAIAGRPLRARFAGDAMADRFRPALEHLHSDDAPDEAHVAHVWDAAAAASRPRRSPGSAPASSTSATTMSPSR